VSGVKLTWDDHNAVLVQWDDVIIDNITGYKVHWSSQSNHSIRQPFAATNNTVTQFFIPHDNRILMDVIKLHIYIWAYNLAGDGPVTTSGKHRVV